MDIIHLTATELAYLRDRAVPGEVHSMLAARAVAEVERLRL